MTTPSLTPPLDSDNLKRCCHCHEWKPREAFSRNKRAPDGLQCQCKACCREYRACHAEKASEYNRKYRAANATRIAEQQRERYIMTVEKQCEYSRRYYAANRERISKQLREYRTANCERLTEYRAARADKKRERDHEYRQTTEGRTSKRAGEQNRRARKLSTGGIVTAIDLTAVRAAQTDKRGRLICWRCGKPITDTPHLDHWIPLKHGGRNDAGNLHFMHAKCNLTKNAKHPTEIGRLL